MNLPNMSCKKHGSPISILNIDNKYIIAIYQGTYGDNPELDIKVAYREKFGDKWTKIRQPKHIHWAVDILVKKVANEELLTGFVQHMLELYDKTTPLKNKKEQQELLQKISFKDIERFNSISNGFYAIKFIYCVMYLLMVEEKTSNNSAHMFKDLLHDLVNKDDFYGIVNKATHNGKKK